MAAKIAIDLNGGPQKEGNMKVTQLEYSILCDLMWSEFTEDGHGICGHIYHNENNMKKIRGALASLVKKGIICVPKFNALKNTTWAYVTEDFQSECKMIVKNIGVKE